MALRFGFWDKQPLCVEKRPGEIVGRHRPGIYGWERSFVRIKDKQEWKQTASLPLQISPVIKQDSGEDQLVSNGVDCSLTYGLESWAERT